MLCQRCGNCCVTMPVVILSPGANGEHQAVFKSAPMVCPHLSFAEGRASCAVHDLPEYQGSPCHIYGNASYDPDFLCKRGKPCQVGLLLLASGRDVCAGASTPLLSDLDVLGPWEIGDECDELSWHAPECDE